jgi:hypothetical protein
MGVCRPALNVANRNTLTVRFVGEQGGYERIVPECGDIIRSKNFGSGRRDHASVHQRRKTDLTLDGELACEIE